MDQNQQLAAMLAQMQGQQQPMIMPSMMQAAPQNNDQAVLMQLQQIQQMLGILLQAHYEREQRYANKQSGGYGGGYNSGGNRYGNYGGGYNSGGNRYGGGR